MAQVAEKIEPTERQLTPRGEVVVLKAPRLPYHEAIQERFGVDKSGWKALVEAIYPNAKTPDAIVMALSYCRARNLDPFKRPVHIVPMWSSAVGAMVETVWPGISELRTTAFRTGNYAGMSEPEFGDLITQTFTGKATKGTAKGQTRSIEITFPEWCRITITRDLNGKERKFVGPKVFWLESYAKWADTEVPNEMWAHRPSGQLEKCAEAAALRRAFPEEIGNDLTAEEMAGQQLIEDAALAAREITPKPPAPPAPPPPPDEPEAVQVAPPAPQQEKIKPTRKERQQASADDKAACIPDAETDPESFLKWADELLAAVIDPAELENTFNNEIEPRSASMFPPDRDELSGIYRKHEDRLQP